MKNKTNTYKGAEVRSENDAFKKIRPALENIGWRYTEKYVIYFEYKKSLKVVITSALKLENEGTVIAIIPCGKGIEIAKEGIPGPKNFYFRFLNNLLYFLIENGIKDIYQPLFRNDGHTSMKDRTGYEKGLIINLKNRGFVALRESNKAKLDVNSFLEIFDQGAVDYNLLSKSFENSIPTIVDKTVEVHFVFLNNEEKNFIVNYYFGDYNMIRQKVNEVIKEMPKEESGNTILKTLLLPALEKAAEMTSEERDLLQQAFTEILERALASENYRLLLRKIGLVMIGTVHCEYLGFENGIDCYGLILDQKSHHFQIKTNRRA